MVRNVARNFTLLEVLIVLAIVGMLAALVTVPLARHLEGAEVEGAATRVQSTLSDAQAEARETGKPVRVIATVDEQGRTGLACHPVESTGANLSTQGAPGMNGLPTPAPARIAGDVERSAGTPSGMEHAFARATRRVQLPTGVTIEGGQKPVQAEARRSLGGMAAAPSDAEAGGILGTQAPTSRTLAIFMPDGSALVRGPIRLSDRDGRSSEVRVNPWTGVAVLASESTASGATGGGTAPDGKGTHTGRGDRAGDELDLTDPFAEWR